MFNPGLGFLEIRATDVDDVTIERIAKKLRAGERADKRHLSCRCDGLTGLRCWRSDCADKRKNLILIDCAVDGLDGFLWLVTIIDRLKFELAAIDAAGTIDFFECRENTFAHALAERPCRPVKGRDLPEQDLVLEYTVLCVERRAGKA